MAIAIYHQDKDRHKGPRTLAGVRLEPGENRISLADSDRLQAHPRWAHYRDLGILEIKSLVEPTPSPKPPASELSYRVVPVAEVADPDDPTDILSLVGFTVAQATPIVEAETDLERLQRWSAADSRVSLKRVISERIRQLLPEQADD